MLETSNASKIRSLNLSKLYLTRKKS